MNRTGIGWFLAWTVAGALVALTVLGILSIGIFVLPFAVAAIIFLRRRSPGWPTTLGIPAGVGVMAIVLGFLNLDYQPCTSAPIVLHGQETYSCGGIDPTPLFLVGSLILVAAFVVYAVVSRRTTVAA